MGAFGRSVQQLLTAASEEARIRDGQYLIDLAPYKAMSLRLLATDPETQGDFNCETRTQPGAQHLHRDAIP